jgi:hypothetical protein
MGSTYYEVCVIARPNPVALDGLSQDLQEQLSI